jgi:hypothetical protein
MWPRALVEDDMTPEDVKTLAEIRERFVYQEGERFVTGYEEDIRFLLNLTRFLPPVWQPIETVPLRTEALFFAQLRNGRHWVGVDEMHEDGLWLAPDASPTHWANIPKPPDDVA